MGPSKETPAVTVSAIDVELAVDRDVVEVAVTGPTDTPGARPPVPTGTALGYVDVETDLEEGAVSSVGVDVAVREEALPEGRDPSSVRLYRYHDGRWTPMETTHETNVDGTDADGYRASAPGVSPVAVVSVAPGAVEVVDATVPSEWVRDGHRASVRATVENDGGRTASRAMSVSVDGDRVASEMVTLDPNERTEVVVEFEAREGNVSVEGVEAGALTVGTPAETDSQWSLPSSTQSSIPEFSPVSLALLILLTALVVRAVQAGVRRR